MIVEVGVSRSPEAKNGQPVVAVNPLDHANLVMVATDHVPGAPPRDASSFRGFVAFSEDAGLSWTRVPFPLGSGIGCGEPNLAVDREGTFHLLFNQLGQGIRGNVIEGRVCTSRSSDGGRTWSPPARTPLRIGGYPKLRVDAAGGRLFAVGGLRLGLLANAVTASPDGGRSWGRPHPFPGWHLAVHGDLLATAVGAGVVLFLVSRDEGATFERRVMRRTGGTAVLGVVSPGLPGCGLVAPLLDALVQSCGPWVGRLRRAVMGPFSPDPPPWVTADPTHPGRFAVMIPRRRRRLEVYVTDDCGRTWTGPAVIATPRVTSVWIDYGPEGHLGVMWRDRAVDVHVAVSFDHGRSFGRPVRVNAEPAPPGDTGPPGDDWSWVTVVGGFAYVAWSDGRGGGSIDAVVGRVPLSALQPARSGTVK